MAPVIFIVDEHDVAVDANLVGVVVRRHLQAGKNSGIRGVRDIQDGGPVGLIHMADIGVIAIHDDLTAAGNIDMTYSFDVMRNDAGFQTIHDLIISLFDCPRALSPEDKACNYSAAFSGNTTQSCDEN